MVVYSPEEAYGTVMTGGTVLDSFMATSHEVKSSVRKEPQKRK